jgi:hypothetical protein
MRLSSKSAKVPDRRFRSAIRNAFYFLIVRQSEKYRRKSDEPLDEVITLLIFGKSADMVEADLVGNFLSLISH